MPFAPSPRAPSVDVIVRCRNEMPHTQRTLNALARQRGVSLRVRFVDCRSTDGSRAAAIEFAREFPLDLVDLDPKSYVPGRVLNAAMRATDSEIVAFVNADAVPCDEEAIARLVAPLRAEPRIAATFGRQVPRADASPLTRADYGRAFGDREAVKPRRGEFFSMAASAIRRSVHDAIAFDERLTYSEDVDWTRRIGAIGWSIAYVPEARFEHSHEYTLGEHRKRRRGEGRAEAAIDRLGRPSVARDFARPLVGAIVRDFQGGVLSASAVATRVAQAIGGFEGRLRAR